MSIKHNLIVGRDIPGTRRQNILIKSLNLDYSKIAFFFPHIGFKKIN